MFDEKTETHQSYQMSTPTAVEIGSLITRTDHICGGRPRIAGTGVSVRRIAIWYKLGLVPEEIADRIGHLSLAQVHAAVAYYHANREMIEAELIADEAESDKLDLEHASRVQT